MLSVSRLHKSQPRQIRARSGYGVGCRPNIRLMELSGIRENKKIGDGDEIGNLP